MQVALRNDGTIDPRTVERSEVLNVGTTVLKAEMGMTTGDRAVVEEYLALGVAANRDLRDIKDKTLARRGTPNYG